MSYCFTTLSPVPTSPVFLYCFIFYWPSQLSQCSQPVKENLKCTYWWFEKDINTWFRSDIRFPFNPDLHARSWKLICFHRCSHNDKSTVTRYTIDLLPLYGCCFHSDQTVPLSPPTPLGDLYPSTIHRKRKPKSQLQRNQSMFCNSAVPLPQQTFLTSERLRLTWSKCLIVPLLHTKTSHFFPFA